jgi:hypothetical protein
MTSRREFLQIGVAVTAMPVASHAWSAAVAPPGTPPLPLYAVIYDGRFEQSIAFARRSEALGFSTREISGDVTSLWYNDLYRRWKQGPVAIAGLTGHGAMFCLEQLGRDHRLRSVFRSEHRPEANQEIGHTMRGPVAMLTNALMRIKSQSAAFGSCMADVVTRCPGGRPELSTAEIRSRGELDLGNDETDLYSWVIAPATSAAA